MPPRTPFSIKAMASSEARESLVYIAKLAEQSKRYDVMVDAMTKVAKLDLEPTEEERDLLAAGYRNLVGSRRVWWKSLSSIVEKEEEKEEAKGNEANVKRVRYYMQKVESELSTICADLMAVIDEHLIPSSSTCESTVFFYLMKGDFDRYLAEFKSGDEKKAFADHSHKAYQTAFNTAETYLPPTHPIRLGVALNFSVFYYEIMNSPESACRLAKPAFDEAISKLDNLSEDSYNYKEITLIMEALKDNLTLWTTDIAEAGDNPRMDPFATATDSEDSE